jgi:2-oxoisovalerate dehydrogenase E2 component (dihydrolipoyl transacylase)
MKRFALPDLGEGLHEGEIVAWHVSEGDHVGLDQPLVSVETDKAVIQIPSPFSGVIAKLHGAEGDIVPVGNTLVEFDDGSGTAREDKGTVVGGMSVGTAVVHETPQTVGVASPGLRVTPAVRALAKRLNVDLGVVTPSGPHGVITKADVERVARIFAEVEPLEPLRGARRTMARNMARAHGEVVAVTVLDEADIHAWHEGSDVTARLIRALVAGWKTEPSLNAWYDAGAVGRRVLSRIHLGIAVDTEDGLFVPVLRDVQDLSTDEIRAGVERLKEKIRDRSLPAEELRGNTMTLSNFGMIAGRFANPIILPPTVAILGAGKVRDAVVACGGRPEVHRLLPLSLTFDHRAVTGGEACRFLRAVIEDLKQPSSKAEDYREN